MTTTFARIHPGCRHDATIAFDRLVGLDVPMRSGGRPVPAPSTSKFTCRGLLPSVRRRRHDPNLEHAIQDVVGLALISGLSTFLIGAGAWRLQYEKPMLEALRVIHADRRRRAWIHLWMIPAMFVTAAGVAGYAAMFGDGSAAAAFALMASIVYAMGAVCWVASLAFRLTVVPWAAEHVVQHEHPPTGFDALNRWAGSLYLIHMTSAYAAFALLGSAALLADELPPWVGWLGIAWGLSFLAGFIATRFAGPFNPPFWAHAYTGVVGVALLVF